MRSHWNCLSRPKCSLDWVCVWYTTDRNQFASFYIRFAKGVWIFKDSHTNNDWMYAFCQWFEEQVFDDSKCDLYGGCTITFAGI